MSSFLPICSLFSAGGGLRVLFSIRRVKLLATRAGLTVTTRRLMVELEELLSSPVCEVSGYLTMENDLAIIVKKTNLSAKFASKTEVRMQEWRSRSLSLRIDVEGQSLNDSVRSAFGPDFQFNELSILLAWCVHR